MTKMDTAKLKPLLMDSNEEVLAVLGNNHIETFLSSGILGTGFSILTDRRVYFRGKCLIRSGKRFYKKDEEKIVDLDEVTGTGFVHRKDIAFLVLMIVVPLIAFVLTGLGNPGNLVIGLPAAGLLAWLFWFLHKKNSWTVFEISYAGGGIAFDLAWISREDAEAFQKALRQEKDKKKPAAEQGAAPSGGGAGEIAQYKQLLDMGAITQEEFDAKKKQILGL